MSEIVKVKDLVSDINANRSQKSASRKDEVKVMQAMLNDPTYTVGVYGKEGLAGEYNPCEDFRGMTASIIADAVKISKDEAKVLADSHVVTKAEAESMTNVSKEYINTYLGTGRKMALGGRETSNVSLIRKEKPATTKPYPKKLEDGSTIHPPTTIPAYDSVKVIAPCPAWVKTQSK